MLATIGLGSAVGAHDCIKDDNFCDCGDDEPGTSACSAMTGFQCSTNSHLPHLYIN